LNVVIFSKCHITDDSVSLCKYQNIGFDGREVDGVGDSLEVPLDEVATLVGQRKMTRREGKTIPEVMGGKS